MRFTIGTLARPANGIDFSAATTAIRTGPAQWMADGVLEIPFDRELTPTEVEAVTLLLTSTTNADANVRKAAKAYMDTANPTPAQTVAQVKAIWRLLLYIYEHPDRDRGAAAAHRPTTDPPGGAR